MPQPMPVAAANGVPFRTGTRVCELMRKARFPLPGPGDGLCGRQVRRVADCAAEAGGADHRAIAAREAAAGHVVPFRILDALIEHALHAGRVELPAHAVAGPLQLDLGQADLCLGRCGPAIAPAGLPPIDPTSTRIPSRNSVSARSNTLVALGPVPQGSRSSCRWGECS